MTQIPTYQPAVAPALQQTPSLQVTSAVPADAFGVGVPLAAAGVSDKLATVGAQITQRAIESKQESNNKTVAEAMNRYSQSIQNSLYDTTPNEKGVPKGFLNRMNGDASGATGQYDTNAFQKIQDFSDELAGSDPGLGGGKTGVGGGAGGLVFTGTALGHDYSNDTSAIVQRFQAQAMQYAGQVRGNVISHEATQRRSDQANVANTYATQTISDTPLIAKNPGQLSAAIDDRTKNYGQTLVGSGLDADTIGLQKQQLAGKMTAAAINANIDTNAPLAQNMLDAVKDKIPADQVAAIQKALDGKALAVKVDNSVQNTQGFKEQDGITQDLDAAEEWIRNKYSDQPADVIQKIIGSTLPQLKQQESNSNRSMAAGLTKFSNDLIAQKNKGGTYQQAQSMASQPDYGDSPLEQQQRMDLAKKLFTAPDSPSDPATVNKYNELIRMGQSINTASVHKDMISGGLSNSDGNRILDAAQRGVNDQQTVAQKNTLDMVKQLAEEKFGLSSYFHGEESQIQKSKYLSMVNNYALQNPQKSPGEIRKYGEDLFQQTEQVPRNPLYRFLRAYTPLDKVIDPTVSVGDPKWKTDYQSLNDKQVMMGNLAAIHGKDVVQAMGNDPSSMSAMANEVDPVKGLDYFKPGQPGSKAVKSLIGIGKQVTSSNIKYVIQRTGGTGDLTKASP